MVSCHYAPDSCTDIHPAHTYMYMYVCIYTHIYAYVFGGIDPLYLASERHVSMIFKYDFYILRASKLPVEAAEQLQVFFINQSHTETAISSQCVWLQPQKLSEAPKREKKELNCYPPHLL